MVPVLTNMLTKEEYGMADGVNVFIALILPIIIFGQDSSVARYIFEMPTEEEKRKMISQSFFFQLSIGALLAIIIILTADWIGRVYLNSEQVSNLVKLSSGVIFSQFICQFCSNLLKWHFKRKAFLIITIGYPALTTLLAIFFLKFYEMGVEAVFIGQLVSGLVFSMIGLYTIKEFLAFPRAFEWMPQLLKYGWPYFLIMFLPMVLPSVDRYFISGYLSFEELAVYALAFRIATLIYFPIYGFQTAWGPFALTLYKSGDFAKTYDVVLKIYILVLALFIILINTFLSDIILLLSNEGYAGAERLIMPIMLAIFLESISWVSGIGVNLAKKTYYAAFSYFLGLVIGAVLSWYSIQNWGLLGLVLSGMVGKFVFTFSKTYFGHKSMPIAFDFIGISILTILIVSSNLALNFWVDFDLFVRIPVSFGLSMLLLIMSWRLFLSSEERSKVLFEIRKLRK